MKKLCELWGTKRLVEIQLPASRELYPLWHSATPGLENIENFEIYPRVCLSDEDDHYVAFSSLLHSLSSVPNNGNANRAWR